MNWSFLATIFGVCSVLYCVAKLLHFYSLFRNDHGKDNFFDKIIVILEFALYIVAFPASIIIGGIETLHSQRLSRIHDKEIHAMHIITSEYASKKSKALCPELDDDIDDWKREEYKKYGLDKYY